ncbi:MAG TPA: O-antigen ligase family protein [Thermomonas sp.]|uniref:O-antigen ligase family protein n=1 Tax=Thermomonas sp. TaxID=1971895 RepID=UPI002B70375D|nr:O-antigen ligase family protein [Thermomonas sp.]HOV97010.1 O-antigen ligase family protein [Thermomonas sp.]
MSSDVVRRWLLPALSVLLAALWLGGGVTQDSTSMDEWLQLLALPVLWMSVRVLLVEFPADRLSRCGIGLAVALILLLALQLLPLPASVWNLPAARGALTQDLQQAGVDTLRRHWSLAPAATEQGLWALLPALACFFAAITLDKSQRRRVLQVVIALAAFNVLFAFFQAGLPLDSELRLYDFDAGFGGLFANTNHQATACITGMVLATGLGAEARFRALREGAHPHAAWGYFLLAGVFLLAIPLSTSRAGMSIALPALVLTLVLSGAVPLRRMKRNKATLGMAAGMVLLMLLGMQAALGWMAIDLAEEQRHVFAEITFQLGLAHAPLGSGVGSFVPLFAAASPLQMQEAYYVNHAHNEYAQWWLETGWLGMLLLVGVLAVLAVAVKRLLQQRRRRSQVILAASAWVAVAAVMAHSWADYPLRTLSLMSTTAALAGVMLAALADIGQCRHMLEDARDQAAPNALAD